MQWISVNKTNHAIRWIGIYPVYMYSVIHLLNNPGQDINSCMFHITLGARTVNHNAKGWWNRHNLMANKQFP